MAAGRVDKLRNEGPKNAAVFGFRASTSTPSRKARLLRLTTDSSAMARGLRETS